MTTNFSAKHVSVTEEEEYIVVGFADDAYQPTSYILLQRAYEWDEQDRELGMDAVYIERDDQSNAAYGGITQIDVANEQVVIHLTPETAQILGTDREIYIDLSLVSNEDVEVYAGLQRVCEGDIPLMMHKQPE
jgi:hypothetical protein